LQEVCDIEELMMFLDFMLYLPDDILVKADRASMAAGLEARMPFLDPSVISFAWSLPSELKSGASGGKHILRRLLHRHLPRGIVDRPKQGFGVPIGQWLRGPLRDWAEDLLDPVRMHGAGLLDVEAVQKSWTAHLSGKRNCENELWAVLMLQAWIENQQPPYIGRAQ
jgi:asparagine synthase (glutamine-hydrolysing)